MVAYMLVRRSNIALLDDDAINVVDLAAARKVPGPISPKLHALAAQQEARGWAMHGDADGFRHHLIEHCAAPSARFHHLLPTSTAAGLPRADGHLRT